LLLHHIATGELAPTKVAALLNAIGSLARVVEIDELARRIATLQARNTKAECQS
jgi:hypothetical protein